MRLIAGFLLEEAERLTELAGVEPRKQFPKRSIHPPIIQHHQTLQPREDKVILGVPTITERVSLRPSIQIPLLKYLDEECKIFLGD